MKSDAHGDGRAIWLYVPISQAREYAPLTRSLLRRLKAGVLRLRDRIRWIIFGSHDFDFHAWCVNSYTNRGDIAIREAIRQLLESRFEGRQFAELDWGSLGGALARINVCADMLVICGGGYVSADAASGALSHVMEDVADFANMTCPVVAFGIGYNSLLEYSPEIRLPALPDRTLAKIQALSGVSSLVGVRDLNLQRMMQPSAKGEIALIGDPALFLEPVKIAELDGHSGKIKIGLNFALHGPISASIFRQHFKSYVAFLKRVQQNHPVAFYYFVHCDTERIAISLLRRAGIALRVVDRPPAELISGYAQMEAVIGQMLHSSILATNAGVPSMNIAYDTKNVGFYELMELPHLCVAHDDLTPQKLWETFAAMLEQKDSIARVLENKKIELRLRTNEFLEEISALLAKKSPPSVEAGR